MGSNEGKNIWLSIAAGIFATFMMYSYSQEKKAEYDKKYGSTKRVVVAREDIAEMQTVYDNMIEVVEKPAEFIEPDAVTVPDEVIGSVSAIPIKKGQQLVKTKFLTPGPDTGIALQVAPSMRAVTLPIDEVRGIAKLIRPGDRVDIYAAIDSGRGNAMRREVVVLMQDVVVLATGVSIVNNIPRVFELDASGKNLSTIALTGDSKYSTITIEASPKDAQDLIYILSTTPGNLFFTLRNPNDRVKMPRMPSSNSDSVLGKPVVNLDGGSPTQLPTTIQPQNYVPPTPSVQPARPTAPSTRPNSNGSFRRL